MRSGIAISLLLSALPLAYGQGNPPKLATQARFDLTATATVGSIDNGQILTPEGSVNRMNWIPAEDQPRSYTLHFGAPHFLWSECVFRFMPASNGTVELKLMGPWEQSPGSGPIYRQELFWDALTASNTSLANGSFEQSASGLPVGWTRPYGDAAPASNGVVALDGIRYARTWHDGPLTTSLSVTGGVPVTLQFFARAVLPTNHIDMVRLSDTNSPAHLAARNLMRGVNLGNYLEAPPGQNWGATYSTNDFRWIRDEGFDHVRLPIGWHHHTGPAPDYALSNSIFAAADFLVTNALQRGLGVIVNLHHFDDFTSDPVAWTNKFYSIWRQLALHYANTPPTVVYELINEPKDAATTSTLNPLYAEVIRQIRELDEQRTILVGPGSFNSIDELGALRLPDNDPNLIVTVHSYAPFLFTHQGASWTGNDTATIGIRFPGPPAAPLAAAPGVASWVTNWINDYNTFPPAQNPSSAKAFQGKLHLAKQWSDYYGRPVHIGEFGCYDPCADSESRVNFHQGFREAADALGLGWAMWDWKAGFHYWQESGNGGAPEPPGLRDALFPKPTLQPSGPGAFRFDGAVGKTYVVERTATLGHPTLWSSISTQTLTAPELEFSDPSIGSAPTGFYRVEWIRDP